MISKFLWLPFKTMYSVVYIFSCHLRKDPSVTLGLNLPRTICTIMCSCFGKNVFPLQQVQQDMLDHLQQDVERLYVFGLVSLPKEDFCVFLCVFLAFKYCLFPSRFPHKSSCLVWLSSLSVLRHMSKMKQGGFFPLRFQGRGG